MKTNTPKLPSFDGPKTSCKRSQQVATEEAVDELQGLEANYPIPTQKRKNRRNQSTWIKNVNKKKRNLGDSHKYKAKSGEIKVKPKKRVKEACAATCKKKCNQNFSEEKRTLIHDNFWKL